MRGDTVIAAACRAGLNPLGAGFSDVPPLLIDVRWDIVHTHRIYYIRYQNCDITIVRFVWGHSDTSWAHHHDVTILSQYDVSDTQDDYVTMRSQCCHSVMSQIHGMTTSSWGYSVVTGRCSPCEIIMIAKLWHHQCDVFVRSQWYKLSTSPWGHSVVTVWCHRYSMWPHHHEVTLLSQDDAHLVRSLWCPHDIKIMTSYVWDVC